MAKKLNINEAFKKIADETEDSKAVEQLIKKTDDEKSKTIPTENETGAPTNTGTSETTNSDDGGIEEPTNTATRGTEKIIIEEPKKIIPVELPPETPPETPPEKSSFFSMMNEQTERIETLTFQGTETREDILNEQEQQNFEDDEEQQEETIIDGKAAEAEPEAKTDDTPEPKRTLPRDSSLNRTQAEMAVNGFDIFYPYALAAIAMDKDKDNWRMSKRDKADMYDITEGYFSTLEAPPSAAFSFYIAAGGIILGGVTTAISVRKEKLRHREELQKAQNEIADLKRKQMDDEHRLKMMQRANEDRRRTEQKLKEVESFEHTKSHLQQGGDRTEEERTAKIIQMQPRTEAKPKVKKLSKAEKITLPEYDQKRRFYQVDSNGFYVFSPTERTRIKAADRIQKASAAILDLWKKPNMKNSTIKSMILK